MGNHTASERARAMKAAASLSFSSPFVQASANSSVASSKAENDDRSKSSLNMSMTWEAKGGDTLLCNKYVSSLFLRGIELMNSQVHQPGVVLWLRFTIGEL
jgi:hypothetical protein